MPSKTLTITAYRVLLRSCKELDATVQRAGAEAVILRLPLERDAWRKGVHRLYKTGSDYQEKTLRRLFPDLPQLPSATSFTQGALKECVRANFKAGANAEGAGAGILLDQALRAVRVLAEQRLLAECSSRAVTEGIVVEATSTYLGRVPDTPPTTGERKQRWLWSYRCRVENQSKDSVKLWGRHWVVLDGCFKVHSEVPYGSKGVIGQTPIIEPGSSFEYHSGTELEASCGTMQGSFQLLKLDRDGLPAEHFDAIIRPFKLLSPEQT